jgi:hypothetical protein
MAARLSELLVVGAQQASVRPDDLVNVLEVWRIIKPRLLRAEEAVPRHLDWVDANLARKNFPEPDAGPSILNRAVVHRLLNLDVDKLQN